MHHFEAMKSSNVHFTFFRMGKILEGMLAGAVEAEVPHGVECLRDAKHIWERFGGVIDQLKHATFNSVLHAVEDLGHVIHDIANELEECKATVGTDLDKLREMSKAFTDPWYFIFHVEHDLIVNGQDIHHEIMDAQAQWDNQHFYEYGHSVGLALSKIFLGGKMKNGIPANHLPKADNAYYVEGRYYPGHGYWTHGHWAQSLQDDNAYIVHHPTTVVHTPIHTVRHVYRHGLWYDNDGKQVDSNLVYVEGHYYPHHGWWRHGRWYNNNESTDENIVYVDGHYYPGHGYWRHGRWANNEAEDNTVYIEGHYYPGHGYRRSHLWYKAVTTRVHYVDGHH
jgi:hypothetical protein